MVVNAGLLTTSPRCSMPALSCSDERVVVPKARRDGFLLWQLLATVHKRAVPRLVQRCWARGNMDAVAVIRYQRELGAKETASRLCFHHSCLSELHAVSGGQHWDACFKRC